jgi:glutathione synthase/RimK-type ligase-like ATP-grasp enzyme
VNNQLNKPNVLILGRIDDLHTNLVKEALTSVDVSCKVLSLNEFPQSLLFSAEFNATSLNASFENRDNQVVSELTTFTTVWFRRQLNPVVSQQLSTADQRYAQKQCNSVTSTLEYATGNARWVNPSAAALAAEGKLMQLRLASHVGFILPRTLVSNNPRQIREFVQAQPSIFKPLAGFVWDDNGYKTATYTRLIDAADLQNDASILHAPNIFQELVQPKFEVRVLVFGDSLLAFRLDSSANEQGVRDWRYDQSTHLSAEPTEIPAAVESKCIELLSLMNLKTASFDFIVDYDGRWVFLELNQSGQFLFLEELCPEIPVLSNFCKFLCQTDNHADSRQQFAEIKLSEFTSKKIQRN